ncbi:hypothetical protein [Natrinema limicola]|uniref:Uncharacterized protein n=1 Tax=Natrinema limicola JCM 13563 TaxID=1230457 RepID=M0CPL1_9EURY|nr:hypothetical protein [Natrinema limicola]ELZ25205.1 hypothetical protein C476_02157 [Natrinema limicola JCM 13563]
MTLDRKTAERRRFARLLGTDGDRGSGLPVGTDTNSGGTDRDEPTRQADDDRDGDGEADGASTRAR